MPEIKVPKEIVPGELLAYFYRVWQRANPQGSAPEDLREGKIYLEYRDYRESLIPERPTIWVDREFFRFCLSYIERIHDWSKEDYEIRFAPLPGQLRIQALETVVFCPARGQWIQQVVVSAREFFRRVPKRFMGDTVLLQTVEERIRVDSHLLKARWEEVLITNQVPERQPTNTEI